MLISSWVKDHEKKKKRAKDIPKVLEKQEYILTAIVITLLQWPHWVSLRQARRNFSWNERWGKEWCIIILGGIHSDRRGWNTWRLLSRTVKKWCAAKEWARIQYLQSKLGAGLQEPWRAPRYKWGAKRMADSKTRKHALHASYFQGIIAKWQRSISQ